MILVACIGNIFLGDDGFGVEVARALASRSLPQDVVVKDFGIRGFDLVYALLDHPGLTILVDACPRGGSAGTVYVVEPETTARQLLASCGLDWDPACLLFHARQDAVATASAAQVREPIHARSIGLWRNYAHELEPLARALEAQGIDPFGAPA